MNAFTYYIYIYAAKNLVSYSNEFVSPYSYNHIYTLYM